MKLRTFYQRLAKDETSPGLRGTKDKPLRVEVNERDDPVLPKMAELKNRVFRNPVRLEHIVFECYVDLSDCVFEQTLRIEHCTFKAGLKLADIHVKGRMSLKGSIFADPDRRWLDFARMRVGGLFDATNVTALACLEMRNLRTGDSVWFDGLCAKSSLVTEKHIQSAQEHWFEPTERANCEYLKGKALHLAGAEIGKHCLFTNAGGRCVNVRGQIDLRAKVKGQVDFARASIKHPQYIAVFMNAAEVGDSVFFTHTYVKGRINLLRARVKCTIEFRENTVVRLDRDKNAGPAIQLDSADVGDSIFLHDTRVYGKVDLRTKISNQLYLRNARIKNTFKIALLMTAARVGTLLIHGRTLVYGDVNMFGARIGTGIICSENIHKTNFATRDAGRSLSLRGDLNMQYLKVTGPVYFHHAKLCGLVNLEQADIDGHVDFCGDKLGRQEAFRLKRFDARYEKEVKELKNRYEARLRARMTNTGVISRKRERLSTARFQKRLQDRLFRRWRREEPPALNLRMAKIHGRLWLKQQLVLGNIDAEDAQIEGEANFTEGHVHGDLILRSATVEGRIFREEAKDETGHYPKVTGTVDLRHARLADVSIRFKKYDDTEELKFIPDRILLDHAQIEKLEIAGPLPPPLPPLEKAQPDGQAAPARQAVNRATRLYRAAISAVATVAARVFRFLTMAGMAISGAIPAIVISRFWIRVKQTVNSVVSMLRARTTPTPATPQGRFSVHNLTFRELTLSQLDTGALQHKRLAKKWWKRLDAWLRKRKSAWVKNLADWLEPIPRRLQLNEFTSWEDTLRIAIWLFVIVMSGLFIRESSAAIESGVVWVALGGYAGLATIFLWLSNIQKTTKQIPKQRKLIDFLADGTRFSREFYIRVENWKRAQGDDELANEVFFARRRREGRDVPQDEGERDSQTGPSRPGLANWLWRRFLDFSMGYGVRPARLVHVYILLWLLSWAIFLSPHSVERPLEFEVTPTQHVEESQPHEPNPWSGDGGRPGPGEWGQQRAFFMAMRLQVPLLDMMVDTHWKPADRRIEAPWGLGWLFERIRIHYDSFAAVIRTINLLLVPLIIAGVTGFLKRRD